MPDPTLRAAAWVLLIGGSLAFIGACWPPYRQWSAPEEEGLRVIAAHPIGWRCIHAGFLSGTWVSVLGFALLASALRGRPGASPALVIAVAFGLASVAWTVNIAVRLGVTTWAADQLVTSGAVPPGYSPWRSFAAVLFGAFAALGYLSVAGLGWTVLRSGMAARGLGYAFVAWGLSGGFVVGANVPVVVYIPQIILAVMLLRG